ncbi:hypothetical protein F5X97DRAFT_321940 [Nemania serpens]|nr:hypothetical protein F5X97DRAFT_321940 [Nemania serpens]
MFKINGDLGYQLPISANVTPELMTLRRNRQPPHREEAKTSKISTSTTSPRTTTTSTLVSAPIIPEPEPDLDLTTTSTGGTDTAVTNLGLDLNIDQNQNQSQNQSQSLNQDLDQPATPKKDTATLASATPANSDLDRHHGRHDGRPPECDDPISPEQSTAGTRPSFGDHRSWLFGRSSRRRTSSLSKSYAPAPSSPQPGSSSTDCNASPDPSSSDQGLLPVSPRASTATSPSLAPHLSAFALPPPSQPPGSPKHTQSNGHTGDPLPRQSHTSLIRPSWRDSFHRRSTHQLPLSVEPLVGATRGSTIHDHHGSMPSSSFLHQAPYPVQYPFLQGDVLATRSSAPISQSRVMASTDALLSSSAERSGALSTVSNTTSTTAKPAATQLPEAKAFVVRNGRTYINDSTLLYPLPVDLPELHRQSLRTLLMFQLFGGPILSSAFASKPPTRVLDVGCGAGFWSMMCHRYFAQHGHSTISFTGMDIVPLGGSGSGSCVKPDKEMRWEFAQHDMRQLPWPFADGEFDLVMVKDMAFASSFRDSQLMMEEYLRVLRPGGVLEYWETDSTIRMLRPHAPKNVPTRPNDDDTSSDGGDDEDNAERMGAYVMTTNTPISAPLNPYLVEYNGWSSKALEARGLSAVPCTLIGAYLLQEAESLTDVQSKRLAVPLSEIRWEREGVGGVVTKDGKSYIDSQKGKIKDNDWKSGSPVTAAQSALRRTALETTVSFILSLEPLLRQVSGKSQEEWDTWAGKMTNDLLREGGTSWGECLEVGVWTSRKRHNKF